MSTLPQNNKIVQGAPPTTTSGANTAAYVSVKTGHWLWIKVHLKQAVGHASVITVKRASVVAGSDVTTLANDVQIWANEDCAASDTLVKQTDGKSYTVAADIKNKLIVFGVDPAGLGEISAGVPADVVTVTSGASAQATNFWTVEYELESRYKQSNPPSIIVD